MPLPPQWNLTNAPHSMMIRNDGNLDGSAGTAGYIEWGGFTLGQPVIGEMIEFSQSTSSIVPLDIEESKEYQLEFNWNQYATSSPHQLEIRVYGNDSATPGMGAPGLLFNTTFQGSGVGVQTEILTAIATGPPPPFSSSPIFSGTPGGNGTNIAVNFDKMFIKITSIGIWNMPLKLDNFQIKEILGFTTVTPAYLPDWYTPLNWTVVNGVATHQMGSVGMLVQDVGLIDGKKYKLTMDVINHSGDPLVVPGVSIDGDVSVDLIQPFPVASPFPCTGEAIWVQAGNAADIGITQGGGGSAEIDNVIVREMYPSGGTVANWDISGDPTKIYWNENYPSSVNGSIKFDNADDTSFISQPIDSDKVKLGYKYKAHASIQDYSGNGRLILEVYNDLGEGFSSQPFPLNPLHPNIKYEVIGVIGDNITTDTAKMGKFTISVFDGEIFSGAIDDLTEFEAFTQSSGVGLTLLRGGASTITFSEDVRGWTSFKSFTPERGLSMANNYYTFNEGRLWKHHDNETRNNFYGVPYESSITPVFNAQPSVIKNFNTLGYEGSQSRIDRHLTDEEFYNLETDLDPNTGLPLGFVSGWFVSNIKTDKQEGSLNEFIEKEGKWFNYIKGLQGQIDTAAFNFQGIGMAQEIILEQPEQPVFGCTNPLATNFDPNATTDDGSCGFPPGTFELQIRNTTSPTNTDGAARVVFVGTQTPATGFTYAWSTGEVTPEITGLGMGPVGLTLTDGQGNDHTVNHPSGWSFVMAAIVDGCTNPNATNFTWEANTDDGSCVI